MAYFNFKNDYGEGAHPNILQALTETNFEQQDGYGEDQYSQEAVDLIRQKVKNQDTAVYFASGGTQVNLIVISSALKPHESVISACTGHINVHEAGAIEATGHKINCIHSVDGKIRSGEIQAILDEHTTIPHMVKPGMVYISNSTEIGSIYNKKDLEELSSYCRKKGLYLFMDGARLGSALTAKNNDLTFADLARLTDVFYIGGTKNGALLGEAIVINNEQLKNDFGYHLKLRGALLAKGRILGIQFRELFKDDLYLKLGQHANQMAGKIAEEIRKLGYNFLTEPVTNQIFPILPDRVIHKLEKKFGFYIWQKIDDEQSAIRIVTSWATSNEAVESFIGELTLF